MRSVTTGIGAVLLLATAGWVAQPARAQTVVAQATLPPPTSPGNPYAAGYAKGYAYFASITAYKVATGNANGPSTTPPSLINTVDFSAAARDGTVDKDGNGYWLVGSTKVGKTNGNTGSAFMTLLGEYTIPGASNLYGIALDERSNMLYISGSVEIFKLDAGAPSALPTLVDTLSLDVTDGSRFYGVTLDTANGYGYVGGEGAPYSVVMFALGAGTGPMARLGRVDAASDVLGLYFDPETSALYSGYYDYPPAGTMWTTDGTSALPTLVDDIPTFGPNSGILGNKNFLGKSECGMISVATYDEQTVSYLDTGDGTQLPIFIGDLGSFSSGSDINSGAIDEHGYAYWITQAYEVYKISPPDSINCKIPATEGGPITLTGTKLPRTHSAATKASKPALAGKNLKVQFQLTRWNAAVPVAQMLKPGASKVWENYNLTIALPGAPDATLHGKPRVAPFIAKSKGPAVADNTLISWTNVPMLVNAAKKNYTRRFTVTTKVAKTFVGNLTFGAVATGPNDAKRTFELVVPVVASYKM